MYLKGYEKTEKDNATREETFAAADFFNALYICILLTHSKER